VLPRAGFFHDSLILPCEAEEEDHAPARLARQVLIRRGARWAWSRGLTFARPEPFPCTPNG